MTGSLARTFVVCCVVLPIALLLGASPAGAAEWVAVDYGDLVDRRVLSHSGEPVSVLLDRLEGRPLPAAGERPQDRTAHALLDPLLEPYAFVLSDALDTLAPPADPPLVEVGGLFYPGQAQPAWVELLRARRLVVESDGRGKLRLILPASDGAGGPGADAKPSREAAKAAFEAAWPVLRHVLAAELRRLATASARDTELALRVYAYRHEPERTRFRLGVVPYETAIRDTRSDGSRPPFDLAALEQFLASGLRLEGGRLDADGTLHLLGSAGSRPARLAGRPLAASDFAVAYRAVAHGGLAEPYMSLDRGFSPHESFVNYGGRLRDTALGLVSLLCDIRFKTFSLGIDIASGRDVRDEVRRSLADFRTHLERFAADPSSAGIQAQQTRLWFYPDSVDLTLSSQGDVLAMRRVRMSAASERVAAATMTAAAGEDPPWTRVTVAAINRDYDGLAAFFPELDDLDQVVRLLSLFTWLERAERAGVAVPDLDALLAIELPQLYTPRRFPQLLTFNALPEAGSPSAVASFDRVAVGQALGALDPRGDRPLPARVRLERVLEGLDRDDPQHAALLDEVARQDPAKLDEATLDLLAYRAERLRMHRLVLSTLDRERAAPLAARQQKGESLRIFSVGIGGLDLGMGQVLARAEGRSVQLGLGGEGVARGGTDAPRASRAAAAPRPEWRESADAPAAALPAHGAALAGPGPNGPIVEVRADPAGHSRVRVVASALDEHAIARTLYLDDKRAVQRIERLHASRLLSYRFERAGDSALAARRQSAPAGAASPGGAGEAAVPDGLVRLHVAGASTEKPGAVRVRLEFAADGESRQVEADFPRTVLERLVMGRGVDLAQQQPMPLAPLPPVLGAVEGVMFQLDRRASAAPWEAAIEPVAGAEDPVRLAQGLNRWSAEGPADQAAAPAVVGTDVAASPSRWAGAPRPAGKGTLLLPGGALPAALRENLGRSWSVGPVVDTLPDAIATDLVVVVSEEPPAACATRVATLSRDPRMRGKLLGAFCLAGPLRPDIPGSIVAGGALAGLGIASSDFVDVRRASEHLAAFAESLGSPALRTGRIEQIQGPFLWYF